VDWWSGPPPSGIGDWAIIGGALLSVLFFSYWLGLLIWALVMYVAGKLDREAGRPEGPGSWAEAVYDWPWYVRTLLGLFVFACAFLIGILRSS
jgi:hypothetical protein